MPSLRTLLSDLSPPSIGNAKEIFYVRNINYASNNGGCCCAWTVPAGVTSATFEMWGGGASGGGSRKCEHNGYGATTGVYAVKSVPVVAGQVWTICAGGSTCDGDSTGICCSCGCPGCHSYVTCVDSTVVACAQGGCSGDQSVSCQSYSLGTYSCCWSKLRTGSISDIEFQGSGTTYIRNRFCHNTMYEIYPGGANTGRAGKDLCGVGGFCQCALQRYPSCPAWPGGVGGHAITCGDGYRTGQHGASGQIKVAFQ